MTSDGRRGITLRPVEATTTRVTTHYSFVLPDKHPQSQHQLLLLLVIVTAITQTCPRARSVGTFSFVFAQFFLAIHTQPSACCTDFAEFYPPTHLC